MLPLLLTINQAAEQIGVARATVYRHIAAGDLDATDVAPAGSKSPKTRVPRESVERFIERRTRTASSLRIAT